MGGGDSPEKTPMKAPLVDWTTEEQLPGESGRHQGKTTD